MVEDRVTHHEADAFEEGWTQARRGSPLLRRHPVGASQPSTPQGSSITVSITRHVLAPTTGVGGRTRLAGPSEDVSRTPRRGRHPFLARDIQRWDVLARNNRVADTSTTKRGNGTKLVVVADGQSVPLAVRLCPSVQDRSHTRRVNTRAGSRPAISSRLPADEAATAHSRQGGQQRRPSAAAQEALDRVDLSSSVESEKANAPRWLSATPLPPPLEHRKDRGLARKPPQASRPIQA